MPLPRCPACGNVIFPSAREGGDASPLCEECHGNATKTGHAVQEMKSAPAQVREEILEPSGPFLLPGTLPPPDVLEHLGSRPPPEPKVAPVEPATEEILIEPSGPFTLPTGPVVPVASMRAGDGAPAAAAEHDEETDELDIVDVEVEEDVVEPSGPFLVPGAAGAGVAPVSLDASAPGVDPYLLAGSTGVRGGLVRGGVRPRPESAMEADGPTIVVDPALDPGAGGVLVFPRVLRGALHAVAVSAQASWTPLAIAFAAGMLAGAALVVAILRM